MLSEHDKGDGLVLVLVIPPRCLHAMLAAEIKGLIPIIWVQVGAGSMRAIFGGPTHSFILLEGADSTPNPPGCWGGNICSALASCLPTRPAPEMYQAPKHSHLCTQGSSSRFSSLIWNKTHLFLLDPIFCQISDLNQLEKAARAPPRISDPHGTRPSLHDGIAFFLPFPSSC